MITPDFSNFKKLLSRGNLVAVSQTIPADLETPVSSFLKAAGRDSCAFLLESAEQAERIGRYSIIGLAPGLILEADAEGKIFEVRQNKRRLLSGSGDVTRWVEKYMSLWKLSNPEDLHGFTGGFVGYLGYENVEHFEDVRLDPLPGPQFPKAVFFMCQDLLIFDHYRKQLQIAAIVETNKSESSERLYRHALGRIKTQIRKMNKPLALTRGGAAKKGSFKANMSRQAYVNKVKRIQEYIRAGDCIQVVLSQRFSLPFSGEDFQIYRALRSVNPSPYMFYFRCGDFKMIGSSPELLVKKTGLLAEVRPIAGTRPRGGTLREDQRYEESLRKSKKELAEHLMLVDLGRNDLGRVCRYDSIKVDHFARVERYSHVMHLVSDVSGKLKAGMSAFDLLKATFPAGTVSGAPKIRAMEIINELEEEERGPYAGCLGYFGLNGDMDMCITIRTMVLHQGRLYLQAGAGIVKDSNPRSEYQETVNKAKALVKALEEQGRFPCFS